MNLSKMKDDNRWRLEVPTMDGRTNSVLYLSEEEIMTIKEVLLNNETNIQRHLVLNSLHLRKGDYTYLHHVANQDGIIPFGEEAIFVDETPTKLIVDISYLTSLSKENLSQLPTSLMECIVYAHSQDCSHIDFPENTDGNTKNSIEGMAFYKGKREHKLTLASLF